MARVCQLLHARGASEDGEWQSTAVVGEHALLYRPSVIASMLDCPPEDVSVTCGLYSQGDTLSPAFRQATDWEGVSSRFDFAMQGASAARLPALFFLHDKRPAREDAPPRRSLGLCSVHFAFGPGGSSHVRDRQLEHLASLMPGASYDPGSCLYALVGDMNSNASVASRGHDLASSELGARV